MSAVTEQKSHIRRSRDSRHRATAGFSIHRLRRRVTEVARYAVLLAFAAVILIPFAFVAMWSLKSELEIAQDPFGLPNPPRLSNLPNTWIGGRYNTYFPNTVIYSFSITTGVCALSCLAGYALARIPFPGRRALVTMFLMGMLLPFFSIMIPLYVVVRDLGILGTRWGLIVPSIGLGLPFGIFLMRAFFLSLPAELSEAAKIDGCTEWSVFWRVFLPLAGPGLTGLMVFNWLWTWNMFLEPLIFLQEDRLRPVGLAIYFFQRRYTSDRGMIAMASVLSILPVLLMYLVLQRKFIEGVTAGALK